MAHRSCSFLPLVLCLCFVAPEALAQTPDSTVVRRTVLEGGPTVSAGSRVRVRLKKPRDAVWQGNLEAWPADTLRVDRRSEPRRVAIPLASIDLLQVSINQKRSTVPGLLIGGMVGTIVGVAVGSGIGALLVGPPAGLVLGGIIGHKVKVDRWKEVPLSP